MTQQVKQMRSVHINKEQEYKNADFNWIREPHHNHARCFNPLNAELNPICHLLALLGAHHILDISRIWVNNYVAVSTYILFCGEMAVKQN